MTSRGDSEGLEIVLDEQPEDRLVAQLERGLDEHALPVTRTRGFVRVAMYLRDGDGRTRGGVVAYVNWNWLFIDTLWVEESLRGQGAGSRLLLAIEEYGLGRGCTSSHLDTFTFQARPFYERHGYVVFATLDDYPPGHSRFFLRKSLAKALEGERPPRSR